IPETRRAARKAGPPLRKLRSSSPAAQADSAPRLPRPPRPLTSRVRSGIHKGEARSMKLQVLPYVTVEVDDRLRRRLRRAGERLRINVRAYLLSAADDVDSVVATVNDRLGDDEPQQPRLHLVAGREAS